MVANEPLIRDRELAAAGFARDLRAFLGLPEEALLAVARAEIRPEGFVSQAVSLNAQFGIPMDEARGSLNIADYLYRRTADLGLAAADAAGQVATAASRMDVPVAVDDKRRNAIAAILSFRRDYEVAIATGKVIAQGPHFAGVNGFWGVKPVQMSNGEAIRVPVVTLSITWHDGLGNDKEAFLQMADRDWEAFTGEIAAISDSRKGIEGLL